MPIPKLSGDIFSVVEFISFCTSYFELEDLFTLSQVCKRFKNISSSEHLWKKIYDDKCEDKQR